jgi:exopolysaccharide biosynthesis polyprenyl glycosylphosphotransferase
MGSDLYRRILVLPFIKVIFDILTIELAIVLSFYLRFYSPLTILIPVTKGFPPFINYFYFSIVVFILYLLVLAFFQSYRPHLHFSYSQEIIIIFKSCVLGIILAMSAAFLYRDFSYSRVVFFLIFVTTLLLLLIQRYIFHQLKSFLASKGFFNLSLLLIGSGETIVEFYKQFSLARVPFFKLKGYLTKQSVNLPDLSYHGTIEDLSGLLDKSKIDGLILAFNQEESQNLTKIIQLTEGKNIDLFYYPEVFDLIKSNIQFVDIKGLFLLKLKSIPLAGWQGAIKRIFDIIISLASILFLSPFLLIIALLIKFSSTGPLLYKQKRVGLDHVEFTMYKFRSMVVDAEGKTGPVWTKEKDERVTSIGRFLRRTSLDEIPQLINVLKGDMSLVGPRPERKFFVDQFQSYIPKYSERHRFRSGMTGWAQVNGLRGQSPIEERTKYDVYYIENWSLWFDLKIIILTFLTIAKGENAY